MDDDNWHPEEMSPALHALLAERTDGRLGGGTPTDPGPSLEQLQAAVGDLIKMTFDISILRFAATYAQAAADVDEPGAERLHRATRMYDGFRHAAARPLRRAFLTVTEAYTEFVWLLLDMPVTTYGKHKTAIRATHAKRVPVLIGLAKELERLGKQREPDVTVWADEVHSYLMRAEQALREQWPIEKGKIEGIIRREMNTASATKTWVTEQGGPTMAAVHLLDRLGLRGRYAQAAKSFFEKIVGTSPLEAFLLHNVRYSEADRHLQLLAHAMRALGFFDSDVSAVVDLLRVRGATISGAEQSP